MIMYFAFYASSPEPLILATTFFINSSLNLYLFLYTMYARMTPIVGTIHISTRIEFCVASDCTAFGTYPVSSSTNPIASEVNAAVSFTISVCKENTTPSFLVPRTGSLALGGFVSSIALMLHMPLFIVIIGLIYLVEVLSVILQVGYFKLTHGKRIFKMAPIHHHFELCGYSETQVVAAFSIVTALLCLVGIMAL